MKYLKKHLKEFIDNDVKEALPNGVIGFVHIYAFIALSSASFFTARLGAKLAHKLPAATLKKAFAVLMLVVGVKLVLNSGVLLS